MSTSRRGVMTARTGRSPSRMTPAIIFRSADSMTPADFRLRHQRADFLVADARLRLLLVTERPQHHSARDIEQPDQRVIAPLSLSLIGAGLAITDVPLV